MLTPLVWSPHQCVPSVNGQSGQVVLPNVSLELLLQGSAVVCATIFLTFQNSVGEMPCLSCSHSFAIWLVPTIPVFILTGLHGQLVLLLVVMVLLTDSEIACVMVYLPVTLLVEAPLTWF